MFVGYSTEHKGFLCYDPVERRLRISRNVIFVEHVPFFSLSPLSHPTQVSYLPHFPESPSPPPLTKVYVCRPKHPQLAPSGPDPPPAPPVPDPPLAPPGPDHLSLSAPSPPSEDPTPLPLRRSSCLSKPPDKYGLSVLPTPIDHVLIPTSYSQASKVPCWQDAMTEELLALEASST